MYWGVDLEWFVAAIIAVTMILLLFVALTRDANKDPTQRELAELMLRVLNESKSREKLFQYGWQDVRNFLAERYPNHSIGQRQTKLAHALSVIRPMLNELDYDLLRGFCRSYRG